MAKRIMWWATAGFAVGMAWVLVSFFAPHLLNLGLWTAVPLTAPAALLGRHRPQSWQEFVAENVAIYAVVGLVVEAGRWVWGRMAKLA